MATRRRRNGKEEDNVESQTEKKRSKPSKEQQELVKDPLEDRVEELVDKKLEEQLGKPTCCTRVVGCGRCVIVTGFLVYSFVFLATHITFSQEEGWKFLETMQTSDWQENLSATVQQMQQILYDLRKPDTWLPSEYGKIWNMMAEAVEAAKVHFDEVELPPLHKLIPLLIAHVSYVEAHKKKAFLSWREWQRSGALSVNRDMLLSLHSYIDMANLAYEQSDTVREQIALDGYELLQWEPQVQYTRPCYFVAFHPGKKEVVVAVRGTSSFTDLVTDVIHTPVPFYKGSYTHLGILEAAKFVVNRTSPLLKELFLPMGYKLVMTGHSLGAGVATIASMIYKNEFDISTVKCFAYAPPPTLNMQGLHLANDYVFAMVHNDDIIPRWNFNILASTFLVIHKYIEEMDSTGVSVEDFYNKSDFEERTGQMKELLDNRTKTSAEKDMHISGRVFYFVLAEKGYIWQEVPNDLPSLRRFEITRNMVMDHSIVNYIASLDFALNATRSKGSKREVKHHHYDPSAPKKKDTDAEAVAQAAEKAADVLKKTVKVEED